jgi:uncharacterized protein (TIGR02118 family)
MGLTNPMQGAIARRMTLLRRRADLAPAAFSDHWAGPHAAIARRYTGLSKYVQNHVVTWLDPAATDTFLCDGMAELWFPGREAMQAALASQVSAELIADEPRFLDGVTGLLLGDGARDDGVGGLKVIVLGHAFGATRAGAPAEAMHVSTARVTGTWSRPALWTLPEPPNVVLVARFPDATVARASLSPARWPALADLSPWHAYAVREVQVV